jgi:hypothetical protein
MGSDSSLGLKTINERVAESHPRAKITGVRKDW